MENIKYKGFSIKVSQDESALSPGEWGDDGVFLVGFHRQFSVHRDGFEQEAVELVLGDPKEEIYEESLKERVAQIRREYHAFPLAAYIHSGVSLSLKRTGQHADRWDSCVLGAVFVAKSEKRLLASAEKLAEGLVKEWNQYLSGEVYAYEIENPDGDFMGSCGGFYGDDGREDMLYEAKRQIDGYKVERDRDRKTAARKFRIHGRLFDTGPNGTIDRYTAIYEESAYGMSSDALSSDGFNQYIGAASKLAIDALGKEIGFNTAPKAVQEAIIDRILN